LVRSQLNFSSCLKIAKLDEKTFKLEKIKVSNFKELTTKII